jgi:hypothetical protein
MRIAVSGSHRTGKSTLVGDLAEALPGYAAVAEPYEFLEEEGYQFAGTPSLEDYQRQLERSLELLDEHREDALFERCPLDFLAYALSCPEGESFEAEAFLDRIRPAVATLSLVVFVPVEDTDRIALPESEDAAFRLRVDEKLREIVAGDALGLGFEVLEVTGNRRRRLEAVLARLRGGWR